MCILSLYNGVHVGYGSWHYILQTAHTQRFSWSGSPPELSSTHLSDIIVGEICSEHWLVCWRIFCRVTCISISAGAREVAAQERVRMMELSCYEMWQSGRIIEDHHLRSSALPIMIHHPCDTEGQRLSPPLNSGSISIFSRIQPLGDLCCRDAASVRNAAGQIWESKSHGAPASHQQRLTHSICHWLEQGHHHQRWCWMLICFTLRLILVDTGGQSVSAESYDSLSFSSLIAMVAAAFTKVLHLEDLFTYKSCWFYLGLFQSYPPLKRFKVQLIITYILTVLLYVALYFFYHTTLLT